MNPAIYTGSPIAPVTWLEVESQSSGALPPLNFAIARHIRDIFYRDRDKKFQTESILEKFWFIKHTRSFIIGNDEKDFLMKNNWTTDPQDLLREIAKPLTSVVPNIYTRLSKDPL